MKDILHTQGMSLEIAIRSLDAIFDRCRRLDETPELLMLADEDPDLTLINHICMHIKEQWIGAGEFVLVCKEDHAESIQYEWIKLHIKTSKPLTSYYRATARIIMTEDNVYDLRRMVEEMSDMGYDEFYLQRVPISKELNQEYHEAYRQQWNEIVSELLDGQKRRLRFHNFIPIEMYEEDHFYYALNEDVRHIRADGSRRINKVTGPAKRERLILTTIMTEACNMNCSYCYVTKRNQKDFCTVTDDILQQVPKLVESYLDQYNIIQVDLFGGEPLLQWKRCKALILSLEELEQKHRGCIEVSLLTNATLLTRSILEFCKSKKFMSLHFSRDGSEESHNRSRVYSNGMGTYQDVKKKLDLYAEIYQQDLNDMAINFVIAPGNVSEFYDSVVSLRDRGHKHFHINVVKEDVWDEDSLALYRKEYEKVAVFIVDQIKSGKMFYSKFFFEPHALQSVKNKSMCQAAHSLIGIAPDGNLYPCHRFFNNRSGLAIGTVEGGIDKESEAYQAFTTFPHARGHQCQGCKLENICQQHCPAAQFERGALFTYIPSNCEINKFNYQVGEWMYQELDRIPAFQRLMASIFCQDCC